METSNTKPDPEVVMKILTDNIDKVEWTYLKADSKAIDIIEKNVEKEAKVTFIQLHEEEPEGQKTLTNEQATYLDILYDE